MGYNPQESHPRTPAKYYGYTYVGETTPPCPLNVNPTISKEDMQKKPTESLK